MLRGIASRLPRHAVPPSAQCMGACYLQVVAYFAPQFAEMRRRCVQGGEAAFIVSLCRCRKWATRGGASQAYFAKTRDDRYIIKSLSKVVDSELERPLIAWHACCVAAATWYASSACMHPYICGSTWAVACDQR